MLLRTCRAYAAHRSSIAYKVRQNGFTALKKVKRTTGVRNYSFFQGNTPNEEIEEVEEVEEVEATKPPTQTQDESLIDLEQNMLHLTKPGGESVYVIGTCQKSSQDAKQIRKLITDLEPDMVAILTCKSRLHFKFRQSILGLFYTRVTADPLRILLGTVNLSTSICDKTAISAAKKLDDIKIAAIDIDQLLIFGLTTQWYMEQIRKPGAFKQIPIHGKIDMDTLSHDLDRVKTVVENAKNLSDTKLLVDIRALIAIDRLHRLGGKVTVAHVGVAHLDGIKKYWEKDAFKKRAEELGLPNKVIKLRSDLMD